MKYSEDELIASDAEDLSESDKIVILITNQGEIMKTRLQKISLIYNQMYGDSSESDHNAYFFGGYSDSIDESAENLLDIGILGAGEKGYILTEYGQKLLKFLEKDRSVLKKKDELSKINASLEGVQDRHVIGLTYRFYKESAINSAIKTSVESMNEHLLLNGTHLLSLEKDEFENCLRTGKKISITRE